MTSSVRGILFLFAFRKKKQNKTKQNKKQETRNKVQAKILKFIQSLNDDTTALSYQVFFIRKNQRLKGHFLEISFLSKNVRLAKMYFLQTICFGPSYQVTHQCSYFVGLCVFPLPPSVTFTSEEMAIVLVKFTDSR